MNHDESRLTLSTRRDSSTVFSPPIKLAKSDGEMLESEVDSIEPDAKEL